MLKCTDSVANLKKIKQLQEELNPEIERFLLLNKETSVTLKDKNEALIGIYEIRRTILNNSLMVDRIEDILIEKLLDIGFSEKVKNDIYRIIGIIYEKTFSNEQLTKNELVFFYEAYLSVTDDRLEEIKELRDIEVDMPIIFECKPNQIVHNKDEFELALRENIEIKAYVGRMFQDFFQLIPDSVEHIYGKFPESEIRKKVIKLGTKTKENLLSSLGDKIIDNSKLMINSSEFNVSTQERDETLVIICSRDFDLLSFPRPDNVTLAAFTLGLDLCDAEVGPYLRLQYHQPDWEMCMVAMEPIKINNDPQIFAIRSFGGKELLGTEKVSNLTSFDSSSHFVFSLNKKY